MVEEESKEEVREEGEDEVMEEEKKEEERQEESKEKEMKDETKADEKIEEVRGEEIKEEKVEEKKEEKEAEKTIDEKIEGAEEKEPERTNIEVGIKESIKKEEEVEKKSQELETMSQTKEEKLIEKKKEPKKKKEERLKKEKLKKKKEAPEQGTKEEPGEDEYMAMMKEEEEEKKAKKEAGEEEPLKEKDIGEELSLIKVKKRKVRKKGQAALKSVVPEEHVLLRGEGTKGREEVKEEVTEEVTEESSKPKIYALRTTANREDQVMSFVTSNAARKKLGVYTVIRPHGMRGYIFLEAASRADAEQAAFGVPYARGLLPNIIQYNEIEHMLEQVKREMNIQKNDIAEIISGPFKREKCKITRIDRAKEEVVVELLEAAVPIPITVKMDAVRVIRREKEEREEK